MISLLSNEYKTCSQIIRNKHEKGKTWEQIKFFETNSDQDFDVVLDNVLMSLGISNISKEEWFEIFEHVKNDIENEVDISYVEPTIIPAKSNVDYKINQLKGSAWMSYKKMLSSKNFDKESIDMIEESSHRILNNLSLNTINSGTIKGLVIGNVQSGKTANMAALMAMAADQGWNLFIILSGTIESLRVQTQERLVEDLIKATNVSWTPINAESMESEFLLKNLSLGDDDNKRYMIVCLKNLTRLKNLNKWLSKDGNNRKKLKILLIDDEADQAGINTKTNTNKSEEGIIIKNRSAINKQIVNIITNKNHLGKELEIKCKAIDYVAYTATPYANVLNEKPSENSTFPKDFVASLGVSNKYFGPQQVFGLESENIEGLNIINTIDEKEISQIKEIYANGFGNIPNELENAIVWFYCCYAIKKYYKSFSPISMLIHTSQLVDHHQIIAEMVKKWSKMDAMDFLKKCEIVYNQQTKKLSIDGFYDSCRTYPIEIRDYPKFNEIANILLETFNKGLKSIKIDEEKDPTFFDGIHLCIDNYSHKGLENGNEHIRLLYPKEKLNYLTGFIVIGGATLSRGLTIQGLVCSYFLRTVKQADTLMQMGRWFGYRIGYELLQRIWISESTKNKFEFLSVMDYDLRNQMKNMEKNNIKPYLVGIKIMDYVNNQFEITSKNKRQDSIQLSKNFNGFCSQTTMFFEDSNVIINNYKRTEEFVDSLPSPLSQDQMKNYVKAEGSIIWKNIKSDDVINYLQKLELPSKDSKFIDIKLFDKWYYELSKNGELENWNVVISGLKDSKKARLGKYEIGTVTRTRKEYKKDGFLRIGALRAPKDLYVDLDINNEVTDDNYRSYILNSSTTEYLDVRFNSKCRKTSLLVIYVIDKDSKPINRSSTRVPLGIEHDMIGVMVIIPKQKDIDYNNYIGIDPSTFEYDDEVE